MAEWFAEYGVKDVCMEFTGKYWIPVYDILEQNGMKPVLTHPKYVKQAKGRKTDFRDAIQHYQEATMTNENQQIIDAIIGEMTDNLVFGKRAENTIASYKTYTVPFLEHCFEVLHKSPYEATEKDVRSFITAIQSDRELGDRTVNLIISSIHNLFQSVLDNSWNKYKVPFRSFYEYIPFVPTKEEVETLISSIPDPKRKAIIAIMFATGLRQRSMLPALRRYRQIKKSCPRQAFQAKKGTIYRASRQLPRRHHAVLSFSPVHHQANPYY